MQKPTFLLKTDPPALLAFLAARLSISGNKAKRLLDKRLVFINKRRAGLHPTV